MVHKEYKVDIYRETPVRYLGYANEVGEALRSVVPRSVVWLSYTIANCYVLADTIDKGIEIYRKDTSSSRNKNVFLSVSDTLLWQSFASIIIPGITINRICAGVRYIQQRNMPMVKGPWMSIAAGLASIPFIIRPIDVAVEETMNMTFRHWTGYRPQE